MPCCARPMPALTRWLLPDRSKVEHQAVALAARNADHHDLVAGLFGCAQHHVSVVGRAFKHTGFAGTTNAFLAAEWHIDFQLNQLLAQCGAGRDLKSQTAFAQIHGEVAARFTVGGFDFDGGEAFGVCVGVAQYSADLFKRIEHHARSAGIVMGVACWGR